jgi:hypothetical protein
MRKPWTEQEKEFLDSNYGVMSPLEMSNSMNRTVASVKSEVQLIKRTRQKNNPVKEGERFGRLLVIEKSINKGKRNITRFACICDCGTKTEVAGYILRSGQSKSCGCYNSDKAKETHRLPIGEGCYNHLENQCKRGAADRKLPYTLTQEQFRGLIIQNCHWCGSAPRLWNKFYRKDKKRRANRLTASDEWVEQQWVLINGIDRVDNSKEIGYIIENCVPCCFPCNEMKRQSTQEDFLLQVEKIHNHQQTLKSSRIEK